MEITNRELIILMSAVALFLSAYIYFSSGRRKGMAFDHRGGSSPETKPSKAQLESEADQELLEALDETPEEIELNVFFSYNCHDWEAFEVLGVPAGASMEWVEKAYQESLSQVDEASKQFVHAAYQAIQKKR